MGISYVRNFGHVILHFSFQCLRKEYDIIGLSADCETFMIQI